MKCDEKDETLEECVRLDARLDSALRQLGMLSAVTDARRDFLRERRTACGIMRINTHFVSNVTIGYCMRRTLRQRVCPYALPQRHRTKSENSDSKEEVRSEPECELMDRSGLKRCQSLESLGTAETLPGETLPHDVDGVSTRIEKLQVDE